MDVVTDIRDTELFSIRGAYAGSSFSLGAIPPYAGALDFYDDNHVIPILSRGLISESDIFYTRVRGTELDDPNHWHTAYIGYDDRALNNAALRIIRMELNLVFSHGAVDEFLLRPYISIYNRMKYGDFANSLFPYYPLLSTSIPGASDPPLRINSSPSSSWESFITL